MSDNTLEVGQVRVGWLYPGEVEEGKGIPATLVREDIESRHLFQREVFILQVLFPDGEWREYSLVMTQNEKIINMMFLKICISSIITV